MERKDAALARARKRPVSVALRVAGIATAALFVALLVYGVLSKPSDTTIDDSLARGDPPPAPDFELDLFARGFPGPALSPLVTRAAADGRIALQELTGRPVVVNYWASWCVPCREEAPLLEQTWQQVRNGGVVVLGLNMQDVTDDARAFMREFSITYPNVRDPTNRTARDWGVTGLPETFFISPRGKVVGHVIGVVSPQQLRAGITAARAGRPTASGQGGARRPTR